MTAIERIPIQIPRRDGAAPYRGTVVILRDADGVVGVGEAAVIDARQAGWDAAAVVAQEIAELDLQGRRQGVPMAALLGGVRRQAIECTALITEPRPAALALEVERQSSEGFRAFKLKSANTGGAIDGERVGGARWAAGAGARLRLDFNGSLPFERAVSVLPTLEHFGLELVEQPIAPGEPVAAWDRLRAVTHTPLAADESLGQRDAACALATTGVALAIKLATVGGLRAALALAQAATGPVTVGSGMESSIGLTAALHVACALPVEPLACGLATLHRLDGDLAIAPVAPGPELRLPAGPGLGVEIDYAALARYRLDR